MTTYIPALTIPDKIFASPVASILTPIVLGSGVGIVVSSSFVPFPAHACCCGVPVHSDANSVFKKTRRPSRPTEVSANRASPRRHGSLAQPGPSSMA